MHKVVDFLRTSVYNCYNIIIKRKGRYGVSLQGNDKEC